MPWTRFGISVGIKEIIYVDNMYFARRTIKCFLSECLRLATKLTVCSFPDEQNQITEKDMYLYEHGNVGL